jgi:hypothetical protein
MRREGRGSVTVITNLSRLDIPSQQPHASSDAPKKLKSTLQNQRCPFYFLSTIIFSMDNNSSAMKVQQWQS